MTHYRGRIGREEVYIESHMMKGEKTRKTEDRVNSTFFPLTHPWHQCTIGISEDTNQDLPNGPVVENLPSDAGDVVLFPSWETKIPHTVGQLSPEALEPIICNKRSLHATARAVHMCRKEDSAQPKFLKRYGLLFLNWECTSTLNP